MSKSRSSTPTPTQKPLSPSTNIATIDDSSFPGRTQPQSITAATHTSIHPQTASSVISSITPPAPRTFSPRSSPQRGVVRKAEDIPEESPMAKRLRRASIDPQERYHEHSRSSPSSDSQSGMADTEIDQKKNTQNPGATGAAPQKKKRTRTLTTPHQAAVLHALLAQSRFPTTAMREEVGRAIGLSARKVQIWFQNQRQKARRPRSQGEAPSSRAPQYGPYPSTPDIGMHPTSSHSRMPVNYQYPIASSSSGLRSPEISREQYAQHFPPTPPSVEGDTPRLLGPGMPGAHLSRHRPSPSYGRELPMSAPPTDPHFPHGSLFRYGSPGSSTTSPPIRSASILRPVTASSSIRREWDPSRTLPPLTSSRPSTSAHPGHYYGPPSYPVRRETPPIMAPILPRRTPSPGPRFAHQLPDLHPGTSAVHLPPPFTLEPTPQWSPGTYGAHARPRSESWSSAASHSANTRSVLTQAPVSPRLGDHRLDLRSPGHVRHAPPRERTPQPSPGHRLPSEDGSISPPPTSRSGRYDPIREIFVPFTPAVAASATNTQERGGEDKEVEYSSDDHER